MDRIITVAKREFLATVRTKAFLLSVVMMPALVVGGIYGGEAVRQLSAGEEQPLRRLAVVDHTGRVFTSLVAQFEAHNAKYPNQSFELLPIDPSEADLGALGARIQTGELYGYLVLPATVLDVESDDECALARKDNQLQLGQNIERLINAAVFAVRFEQANIVPEDVERLQARLTFRRLDAATGTTVSDNEVARLLTPFAFMFLLFMGTFGISQGLLTTVIEEKSSRVVEVLLSAVSSTQLMAGKILGMVCVGFLLMAVWGSVASLGARAYDLGDLVNGYRLTMALLYFVPGFLLMASLLAAIGSACNELKEAQSMVFPLSLITIVPMISWFHISEHPASMFSLVLSYIPPITPFVMILRICADPDTPMFQIVTTLGVLWVSVAVAMWAAGKVFRVGVLMYGKQPSPRELLRWVRHS